MLKTMRHAWSSMARGGARWQERDGIGVLVTPSVPERSIVNSVILERGADVESAYDWRESEFSEVHAWTVWVPKTGTETETAKFLESRGHVLDADPAMMLCDL